MPENVTSLGAALPQATLHFTEPQLDRMFRALTLDEKVFCIQSYLEAAR